MTAARGSGSRRWRRTCGAATAAASSWPATRSPRAYTCSRTPSTTASAPSVRPYCTPPLEAEPADHLASLRELLDDVGAGKVEALLILGGNPAYSAPADLNF